ncbi:PaaI family thioesterase [Actinomycetaceae bacterium MB13-C1-2]|nr:PaaI family thioesterase [Actinomycetaceae bacterium MB13-C1-2]
MEQERQTERPSRSDIRGSISPHNPGLDSPSSGDSPALRERYESALGAKMGMDLISATADETIIRMPVEGNTQILGILHGGATAALCESAGSIAATRHAWKVGEESGTELVAVGTDLTMAHVRSIRSGTVTAVAKAVHLGRRTTVHEVTVTDQDGRVISTCLARNMIIEP